MRVGGFILTLGCAAVLAGCGAPDETTFVLTNTGTEDLYVSSGHWVGLTASGKSVVIVDECLCHCAGDCPVCGISIPQTTRVPAGESTTEVWSGVWYEHDDGAGCFRQRRRSADFEARICFGSSIEPVAETGSRVLEPTCTSVGFERGERVEVEAP